jgi:prephenate dehydrogenase
MPTVGVIGTGLIGRAWANVFARAGWDVRLWDPDKTARAEVPRLIAEALRDVARHGLAPDPAAAAGSFASPCRATSSSASAIRPGALASACPSGSHSRTFQPARANTFAQARPIRPVPTIPTVGTEPAAGPDGGPGSARGTRW